MQSALMPCLEIQGEEWGNQWLPHNPISRTSVVREIRQGGTRDDGRCVVISAEYGSKTVKIN